MIIIESSEISDLECFHMASGTRHILCQWEPTLSVSFDTIVFTRLDGSEILSRNVTQAFVKVEFDDSAGDVIKASVRDVSTTIQLTGV